MAEVTFKGSPVQTSGELPAVGQTAPDVTLTTKGLEDVGLGHYAGKRKVLSIVPSLDTSVCAASARAFNQRAAALDNTVVLTVSADLPFAQGRFCEAEGIDHVEPLSCFRSTFGDAYGMTIVDGPLSGLLARGIVVLNEDNQVMYTELVPEITQEPNYDAALAALA